MDEQGFDLSFELVVAFAGCCEKLVAVPRVALERGVTELLEHGATAPDRQSTDPASSCLSSHSLAMRQSLFTVSGDT